VRVQAYKEKIRIAKKKEKEELIRKFTEQMQLANEKMGRHKDSELVTDAGIEVDLDGDFSDFSIPEEEGNVVDLSNFETIVEEKTLDEVEIEEVVVIEEAPVKAKKPRKTKKASETENLE
jgi:deoxycytidine triphosphate deaminase